MASILSMANILPDDILENIVCSECKKYLSVKPIKIYPNRQIKCGRCVEEGDNGVESLYGLFAEEVLFPCVNRFENCKQLLKSSEVNNHEKSCRIGSYQCLICNEFNGSAYELFMHCRIIHKNNVIDTSEFPINNQTESMEQYYLYRQGNFLFLVNVRCEKRCDELGITMTFIGPEQKGQYLKYQFVFYNFKREITYTTRLRNCLPFGASTDCYSIKFSDLGDNEQIFLCKIKLNSSECDGLIVLSHNHPSQIKKKPKSDESERGKTPLCSFNNNLVSSVTRPTKRNLALLEFNKELQFSDILESPFRPSIKRKLVLNPIAAINLPNREDTQILLSNDQTSLVFTNDDTKIELEMICFGCKKNLPIFLDTPIRLSKTVYGCVCPNNIVCYDCFTNWNFKTCKKGHPYTIKIEESTILAILHYHGLKNEAVVSDLSKDFLNNVKTVFKTYCICSGGSLFGQLNYLDIVTYLLNLNLSSIDLGLFIYHAVNCKYISCRAQLRWLSPFFPFPIYLVNLIERTFISVVDTIIVIEKFKNDISTVFKVQFYKENENKSIASILNFSNRFQIFKDDFAILNTDISKATMISFRII